MSIESEFEAFWLTFPRHTGKLAAQKSYKKARTMASAQQLLDGVDTYRHTKPAYADWCHPATWLNQGRWMDEPDRPREDWACQHTPHCNGRHECATLVSLGR